MEDEQERYLDDAKNIVKEQAYFMKKALDQAILRDALKHAAIMLAELKTPLLSPRNYYQLFMQIFDEMRVLESYFKEEYRRGRNMLNLYETVQHATNLIPRLYLLITVGSVYIQTHEVPAKEILNDLMEMIKAVQNPLSGLFIRYYFLKLCKERLPDKGSEYEGQEIKFFYGASQIQVNDNFLQKWLRQISDIEGGDINDALNVILKNLNEMNKLWIRMSGKSYKNAREKERIDLKMIIGENIVRLSDLEGVNVEVYKENVLPKLLEIVLNSKDHVSQHYIIDCLIQAFPDEYHLATLEDLLQVTTQKLDGKVDIKSIFIRLMDRLADYAQNSETEVSNMFGDVDIYKMFKTNIDRLVDTASSTEFKNVLDLMVAFLKFTLRCYEDNTEYVNLILQSCVKVCERQHQSDFDDDCLKNLVKFLTLPLQSISLQVLTMNEYPNLMKYLPFPKRRTVAFNIAQAVVTSDRKLDDMDIVIQLLDFIKPLLISEEDYKEISDEEFAKEQRTVAKLVHLVDHEEPKKTWKLLDQFLTRFKEGEQKRQVFTYPASFFAIARLARRFHEEQIEMQYETLFDIMKEYIDDLAPQQPLQALKLYLQLVLVISEIDTEKTLDEYTYDIASQALLIYEEELQNADEKKEALGLIVGTLNATKCLGEENYETLATNATQFSSQLLKKPEQCLAVLKCTHLFFTDSFKDESKVLSCFKKTIKLAATCIKQGAQNINLYIHILNKFFYFWSAISVKPEDVQQIIDTIKENIPKLQSNLDSDMAKIYWEQTKNTILSKQQQNIEGFDQLQI